MPIEYREREAVHSDEVDDFISKPPAWILRWGATILLVILCCVGAGAYFISYPEVVSTPLVLSSSSLPVPVASHVQGQVQQLLVEDRQNVSQGQELALMESTANYEQVLRLTTLLDSLQAALSKGEFERMQDPNGFGLERLGELQVPFQVFNKSFSRYRIYSDSYYQIKRNSLKKELAGLEAVHQALLHRKSLHEDNITLAEQEFEKQEELYRNKVISATEFSNAKSLLLGKRLPLTQVEHEIFDSITRQNAKRNEIIEFEKSILEEQEELTQALQTMQSHVSEWRKKYIVTAPQRGEVVYSSFLQENQLVEQREILFHILVERQAVFGEVHLPQQNLGKVKVGQLVLVKFDSFPFQEFGNIIGKVAYISDVPTPDGEYLAKVILPEGLVTTYGKTVHYRPGMLAKAEIVTEDIRLLEKVLYSFRRAFAK
ncbi:HlyD family secretion protein [Pontibacter litorisediminis]|uniref:HlyD family secretion protein n=1 Tax=Pontibacter litorisediminis TaxID=1846260 RepID=UPI0023EC0580|nr:HlyD family efflux transporter periplasmic adaptor subunit [Pontibacter litorisediminis]